MGPNDILYTEKSYEITKRSIFLIKGPFKYIITPFVAIFDPITQSYTFLTFGQLCNITPFVNGCYVSDTIDLK